MRSAGVAPSAHLHSFNPQGGDFFDHLIQRQMVEDRIKNADGNLPGGSHGIGTRITLGRAEQCGCVSRRRHCRREQSPRGGHEISAAAGV